MVPLINIEDLKRRVEIAANVSDDKLMVYITEAQEQFIRPIVCQRVYDRLLAGLENNSLTTDEATLVDQIKNALVYRTFEKYLPFSDLNPSKTGFKKQTADTAENITAQEKQILIKDARSNANHWESELRLWLNNNFDEDEDYKECNCGKPSGIAQLGISRVKNAKRPFEIR